MTDTAAPTAGEYHHDWPEFTPPPINGGQPEQPPEARRSRDVDLTPYLDGTYEPPEPCVGGSRADGIRLLYPSRWHTVIALTTAGKSWFGLWNCVAELAAGNHVVYLHFEEANPGGTIQRLLMLGVDPEVIRTRFHWFDCGERWELGDFAAHLEAMPIRPTLVVLDGINAACTQHGWKPNDPEAVGSYRSRFVAPAARRDAAVLSLGHPPKARDRQDERHGFGSTGWLDEVDGIGFRLVASKSEPIRRSRRGHSTLYVVKDRHGEVDKHGRVETGKESGWYYMGLFEMDNTAEMTATVALTQPAGDPDTVAPDALDKLADRIVYTLVRHGGRFESQRALGEQMRAWKVDFANDDLGPALVRLADAGRIEWPQVPRGRPRPGWVLADDLEAAA